MSLCSDFRRTKFLEIHKFLGFFHTQDQAQTIESIHGIMLDLRAMFPQAGAREMISHLLHSYGMSVSRLVNLVPCYYYLELILLI